MDAARLMDGLFLEQVWAGNPALLTQLAADRTPEGQAELHYFLINKGPWSRLDHNEPFLRPGFGVPAKPPQANFYPADATKEEVDAWIGSLKGAAHARGDGLLHRHPARRRRQAHGRAVQRRVPEHAGRRPRRICARPRRSRRSRR